MQDFHVTDNLGFKTLINKPLVKFVAPIILKDIKNLKELTENTGGEAMRIPHG